MTVGPQLLVFDFDETIVACNSDVWINQLSPGGTIPSEIKSKYKDDWNEYMRNVFKHLNDSGVSEEQIKKCLEGMPLIPGMKELFLNCKNNGPDKYELIIISDANTVFINHFLLFNGLDKVFRYLLGLNLQFSY